MSANEFNEDCAWSQNQHLAQWWDAYYRKAFPSLIRIENVGGPSAAQRAGIDKFVVLAGGKKLAVDEKVRRNRRPEDICIEFMHVPLVGEPWPGWIEKPCQFTDYLAMGFMLYRVAFFFPFPTLSLAWAKNKERWKSVYYISKSPNPRENPRYITHSVCVPTHVLMGHLLDAMRVQL